MAYDLERHKQNQVVKKEEYKVKIIEKEQAVLLEEHEIKRMEKELDANVKKPAEAKKFESKQAAEADAYRLQKEAEANAEAIKLEGSADAEAMMKKAESWQKYSEAAMFQILMDKLPELAESVARPLSKVDRITVVNSGGEGGSLGVNKITGEVAKILGQMPEVIESVSGINLKNLITKNSGSAKESKKEAKKTEKNEKSTTKKSRKRGK